ncbi:MAG: hypothetical protein R3293_04950 [Candidatus Promineifilaceae bacterium]|nr:hypothetical protein [Candidatus Promineifilaceae bacterium]
MIEKADVWNNALEVMQAYTPFYQKEAVQEIADAHAQDVWFALLLARGAEPQLFNLDYLQKINPYGSPSRLSDIIATAAEKKFLRGHESGSYHLTAKGKAVLDSFFDKAHVLLAAAPSLPEAQINTVVSSLAKIVAATESAPEPVDKSTLASSRWTDPKENAQANLRIDQYITDLLRYRDDAHRAAWQPAGLSGIEWETLTFVWNDEAHTASELVEKLERRGYSEADYQAALDRLVTRQWLQRVNGQYQLTAEGRQVREDAEVETDRLFYLGWFALDEHELAALDQLLQELAALLKESVAAEPVAA